MTRNEFLDILESSQRGELPPAEVEVNLRYYREYIAGEVAKGRSEQQVLEDLGDPRLIARSILNAAGSAGNRNWEEAGRESRRPEQRARGGRRNGRNSQGGSWKWILLLLVAMLLILSLVTRMIFLVLRMLLSPVFWIFIALAFGAGYFFRRR